MPYLDSRGGSVRVDHLDFGRGNFIRLTSNVLLEIVSGDAVITLPTSSLTLATLTGTETLTNKTLTAPVLGAASATSLSLSAVNALTFTDASAEIIPGATSLLFRNNADNATNLSITDAGLVTVRAGVTITAGGLAITAGVVTGIKNNPFIDAAGNDTLTVARSGEVIIANEAATQSYALPAATNAGVTFTFVCGNAGGQIELNPDGADTVSLLTDDSGTAITSTATTGTVLNTAASNVKGDTLTIVADGVSNWYMISQNGIWSVT